MRTSATNTAGLEHTLKSDLLVVGTRRHSSRKVRMLIRPGESGQGIHFLRRDVLAGQGLVGARWYYVKKAAHELQLQNEYGIAISGFEPLLAALYRCGIDNAMIELDGPEVVQLRDQPEAYMRRLQQTGIVPQARQQYMIWIEHPLEVRQQDNYATLLPDASARISLTGPELTGVTPGGIASLTLWPRLHNFAPRVGNVSRFHRQLENLRARGCIDYSKVLDITRYCAAENILPRDCNDRSQRLLDNTLAYLALTGVPVMGHLYVQRVEHKIMGSLIDKLFDQRRSWSHKTLHQQQVTTQHSAPGFH